MRNRAPLVYFFPVFFLISCVTVVLMGGCALPLGEDYTIERRDNSASLVIGNYDLQVYVPVPVAGAVPVTALSRGDLDLQVVWKDAAGNDISGSLSAFTGGEVYQADITISAKNGWSFDPGINFQYPAGSVTTQPGPNSDPSRRTLTTISYHAAAAAKTIDLVDLSAYIPAPVLGGTPVISFAGIQYTGTVEWNGGSGPNSVDLFKGGVIYTATVSLAAGPGYVFVSNPGFYHTGDTLSPDPAALTFTIHPGNSGGTLSIVFPQTRTGIGIDTPIDLTDLIPAPYAGGAPTTTFVSPGLEYSGTVRWKDSNGAPMVSGAVFQYGVTYIAEAVLTAASGFVFPAGLVGTDFTHLYDDDGIPPVYIPGGGGTGTITISFGPAKNWNMVSDYVLQNYIPLPVVDGKPVWAFDRGGVIGTISWDYYTPAGGYQAVSPLEVFHCGIYRATISLQAKNGYKFNPAEDFDYGPGLVNWGPGGDQSGEESRSITVVYKELTGSFAQKTINTWESNALDRIQAAKTKNEFTSAAAPLYIDLSPGEEYVTFTSDADRLEPAGAVLTASNSPAYVRIDGRGRRVWLTGAPTGQGVITVGSGVTLYLRNITLAGIGSNDAPLINVERGGILVLEHGAVIEGNTNTNGKGGGIYNKGTFIMKGGEISGNKAGNGSGVYTTEAIFILEAGKITGNTANDWGGGVYQDQGTFTMKGGEISGNEAVTLPGGGVHIYSGTFKMEGGEISGNKTTTSRGGGVFQLYGTFIKTGGIIYGNTTPGRTENNTALNGHAVYLDKGKIRDADAGPGVRLYAKWSGSWIYNDTSSGGLGNTTSNW
ncbi:hypothetical protein LQZ21_09375 [Treponema sp. TIM-1]|uniref:hypothetical protein n=1 Tax=Treponema sp. TIM-1 TaxID=2898417 RepID=UPI00397FC8FA